MKGRRIKIEVQINLDAVPGWGDNPQDFVNLIQQNLNLRVPHYDPEVHVVDEPTEDSLRHQLAILRGEA